MPGALGCRGGALRRSSLSAAPHPALTACHTFCVASDCGFFCSPDSITGSLAAQHAFLTVPQTPLLHHMLS
jgi:hypothetical protein